jgi:hypothetical protein
MSLGIKKGLVVGIGALYRGRFSTIILNIKMVLFSNSEATGVSVRSLMPLVATL